LSSYSSQDNRGFKCIGAMGSLELILVVNDVDTIEVEEPFVVVQEDELVKKLKEIVQIPP